MMGERDSALLSARPQAAGASARLQRGPATAVFSRRFSATDTETRTTLLALVDALALAGIGTEDASNAELVLAEALNNITEHAYADGPGPVDLTVERSSSGLWCTLVDRGRAMPLGTAPAPDLPQIAPPDHLPEGGFGWHIIRCLTTHLTYRRDPGANRLSLCLPWAGFD